MRKKNSKKLNESKIGKHRKMPLELYSFDTMEQCAATTGLPVTVLQWAKAHGCGAFRNSRVYFLELFKWIVVESRGGDSINWSEINEETRGKMNMVELAVELRELIHKDEVKECVQAFAGVCFGAMKRMTLEFPRNLEMRNRAFIKKAMEEGYEETLARARAELEKLKQAEAAITKGIK